MQKDHFLRRLIRRLKFFNVRQVRRFMVAVVGFTVLIFGLLLVFLPGPAFIVVPTGLAILATEFVWAKRWLQKARQMFNDSYARFSNPPKKEQDSETLK